jgi:hypothetical protein
VWNKSLQAQLSILKTTMVQQGEVMKKRYSPVVLTVTCLLGLGMSARAQDVDKVAVNVPFEFVAGGQTLPAGAYTVSRVSDQTSSPLVIRSTDDGVFLLPMVFDGVASDHAELSFEHVGNKYFLSKVETLAGAYAIRTPRAMTQVAQTKDHGTGSGSGAN